MFKNYLKIAFRTLYKRKGYTFINIAGLALGLACCLLILLYVQDELSFDRFHQGADRIYRLVETRQSPEGAGTVTQTASAAAQAMVETFPEVTDAVRAFSLWRATMSHGPNRFYEGEYLFVDPSFFDVFSFRLLQGDARTALSEPETVVLTESAARKYFGDEDPMGQSLESGLIRQISEGGSLRVTGILQDPPLNSHLRFSMLVSTTSLQAMDWWSDLGNSWETQSFPTYVKLAPGASAEAVSAKLAGLTGPHWDPSHPNARSLGLQALTDIHFHSEHITNDFNYAKGNLAYLYIFSAIALFILLIASINYMNLATARSIKRAKEVGLRKAIGADRGQLIRQFLSESILTTTLAAVVALALAQGLLGPFNALTGKALSLNLVANGWLIGGLFALVLGVGLLSGSYPALYLSGFRPAQVLKGTLATGSGPSRLRQGLVITQFALSIILMAATVVVYNQLDYIQNKRLGFNQEQLVVIDINSGVARSNFQTMKAEFERSPAVRSVSASSRIPGDWKGLREIEARAEGRAADDQHTMFFIGADEDFLETYEIELADGRNFSKERATDSTAVLLNETAARTFGFTPENALGQVIRVPAEEFEARVIGIVKDFHFRSLHEAIGPLLIGHWNNPLHSIDYFTVRVDGQNLTDTIGFLSAAHYSVEEATLFEYNFLDQRLNDFYLAEQRTGRLFGLAAGLAILIACLGLFGLAAFMAEQRTKEIGVRKVLGASVSGIMVLLSKEFVRLLLIAFLIAAPVAYMVMHRWLQDFAYAVDLGLGVFLLAGALALAVALLTVSYQALKAALADPVEALRYE